MRLPSTAATTQLALLLVFLATGTSARRRCKYDTKSVKWSSCDPVLHVQTRSLPLVRGADPCPETKTVTRPCNAGIHINGCVFVPVSGWSECDPTTLTSTRTLELRSRTSTECDNTQLESRVCGEKDNSKDSKDRRKGRKRKRKKGRARNRNRGKRHCRYKKGKWSACDLQTKEKIRIRVLKKGPSSCLSKKRMVKKCNPKWSRSQEKHKKHKKTKDKPNDVQLSPPKLREMKVWPSFTSVEVLWVPPDHGTVRGYQVGYGISVPDVHLIQVNASVLHYIIQDLEPEQEYIVSLRARNKAGLGSPLYETVRTGRVKDSNKTGPLLLAPVGVRAVTVSANGIEVSWSDSSVLKLRGGMEDTAGKMYTVRYMQLNHLTQGTKPKFVTATTSEASLLVQDLLPYTHYEFAVRVAQGSDRSVWSMAVANTTFTSAPSSKPAEFTADIEPSDPTTVKLTWQPPEEPNGPITGFVIFYSKDPILPDATWATSVINGNHLSTLIKDLDPNSAYFFKIQARNKEGVGPTTTPVTVTVPDVLPSAPRDFASAGLDQNLRAVVLQWQRPEKVFEPLTGYIITYSDDPNLPDQSWVVHNVKGDNHNTTIKGLRPNTKYFFKLQALSKAGLGPPTSLISHVLPDVEPSVPRDVSVMESVQLPGAIVIKWLPPLNMGEPIIGYIMVYKEEGTDLWMAEDVQEAKQSLMVRELKPNTTYSIKVQARTNLRLGPASPVIQYSTPADLWAQLKAPVDLQVTILSSTSAILSWRDPMQGIPYSQRVPSQPPSSSYTVRYGAYITAINTTATTTTTTTVTNSSSNFGHHVANYTYLSPPLFSSLYLVNLTPNTVYEFAVRFNRGDQHSAWSMPVYNKTLEDAPTSAPTNITVMMSEGDPSMATITWDAPLKSNGVITGYLIFYTTHRWHDLHDWAVEGFRGDQRYLTIKYLTSDTKYFFKLQACNAKGNGPYSNVVPYKTPKLYGRAVDDVTVRPTADNPYSAIISWQPPAKVKGSRRIQYYMVVQKDVESEVTVQKRVAGDTLTAVMDDLLPAKTYHFTVQPRFRHGVGPCSAPVDLIVPHEMTDH